MNSLMKLTFKCINPNIFLSDRHNAGEAATSLIAYDDIPLIPYFSRIMALHPPPCLEGPNTYNSLMTHSFRSRPSELLFVISNKKFLRMTAGASATVWGCFHHGAAGCYWQTRNKYGWKWPLFATWFPDVVHKVRCTYKKSLKINEDVKPVHGRSRST